MHDQSNLDALLVLLDHAWQGGFTSKSDMARHFAPAVAMATERNLITTRIGPSIYGNKHLITPQGLTVLWSLKGLSQ
jgi:hypothetical protein